MNKYTNTIVRHIIVDLETLDLDTRAPVIPQVGAATLEFDTDTGSFRVMPNALFYAVDIWSQLIANRTVSLEVISYWVTKDAGKGQTFEQLMALSNKGVSLAWAMTRLADYIQTAAVDGVWSFGSTYDLEILKNYYGDGKTPWEFRDACCERTLEGLFPHITRRVLTGATTHRADEDAVDQAWRLGYVFQQLWKLDPQINLRSKKFKMTRPATNPFDKHAGLPVVANGAWIHLFAVSKPIFKPEEYLTNSQVDIDVGSADAAGEEDLHL